MEKDPICGMQVDPTKAAGKRANHWAEPTTSAAQAARTSSIRIRRNTLGRRFVNVGVSGVQGSAPDSSMKRQSK